ncbi:expressed unknown protein [Seminavis robusta]|uniref:Uncharacterized protein n=1 Tax=Seminavis robusta TaxID=568900 RepID=A0A9N8HXI5_9STRA|nr:expressed unknown protein [Seminavis robusta]|eukprot:Sro3117_g344120.1 n/a (608) ;mRNA; f:6746-8992
MQDLSSVQRHLRSLEERAMRLKTMPLALSDTTSIDVNSAERKELFNGAKEIVDTLRMAVEQKKINPSGKHGRALSSILGSILGIYSASYHDDRDYSIFEECLWVLVLLDDWNLNRQEPHYQNAIVVGVHEKRWKLAAELFLQQIDRDASGFCPMSFVSVSSPVGLYAVARDAQESGKSVVDSVMEAVTSLSLISPTDKDRHMLAAGTAIGLAGEWEGLVSYLKENSGEGVPGQPLVAAAMHACLLCNRHEEANEVFRTLTDGNLAISSEFHWGGGQDTTFPLCRDLAMRAFAKCGSGSEAMAMLRQALEEERAVSEVALHGVFSALERDEEWRDAVDLLFRLWADDTSIHVVPGAELEIPSVEDTEPNGEFQRSLIDHGSVLSCVMRACNTAGEFGVALLCFMLVDVSLASSRGHESSGGMMTMQGLLREVNDANELLSAAMIALCGVESFEQAQTLFDLTMERENEFDQTSDAFVEAEQVYHYAQACANSSPDQRRWATCQRHSDRILRALRAIRMRGEQLDPDQLYVLGSALAMVLRSCTEASQPAAGIILSDYATAELARFAPKTSGSHFSLGGEKKDIGGERQHRGSGCFISAARRINPRRQH